MECERTYLARICGNKKKKEDIVVVEKMDERSFLGEAVEVVKRMHSMPELQVEAKRFRVYAGN